MTDAWALDRRRSDRQRVPPSYQARLAGQLEPMQVLELGPGGMVLASPRPRPVAQSVVVVLTAGTERIGPIRGHVAHSRVLLAKRRDEPHSCLVGVSFDQVTAEDSARIASLLAEIDGRRPRRSQDRP